MSTTADVREYTVDSFSNVEITQFDRSETKNGKPFVKGKLEQFTRQTNGKFQFSVLFNCWHPELFDELERMSQTGERYTVLGRFTSSSNADKSKYYTNFVIESLA